MSELLAEMRDVEDYFDDVDPNPIHLATVQAAISALTATGKQQVGESCTHEWRTAGGGSQARRPLVCMKCNQHRDHMPQQVGEVQGVSLPPLPQVDGYDKRVQGHYSAAQMQSYAHTALAARQPGAQADEAAILRHGAAVLDMWEGDPNVTGYMGDFKDACAILEVLALHAAPPAQGIDLGRALDIMWNWQEQLGGHVFDARDVARTLTSSDMQAIGVDARACIDATDRNQAIVLAKREIVRALSGGQRDAAPGVGNG